MKKFLFGFALVAMFFIGLACSKESLAWQSEETNSGDIDIWYSGHNGQIQTYVVDDTVTGVNYIVVSRTYSSGHAENSIAICPRYNADGSLYTGN